MNLDNSADIYSAPLVLVDGSSYLYRAFHALPPLTNPHGEPTGAIYGVINMMRKLLQDYQTNSVAVVFDAKGKTFRNDMYDQYKATRPPMPDELRSQIAPIHDIIKAMGLPIIQIQGVEADDVIGTLAVRASKEGRKVVISTGDKDMAQLVDENVSLLNTMNNSKMDIQGVIDKFGIPPERIIDYLALMGDKSDNVPGVEKVGPKTAVKWLNEYGTLQGVIDNADNIKGKVGENLRNSLEQLNLSQQLVTIKLNVGEAEGLDLDIADILLTEPNNKELAKAFNRYSFKNWLKQLGHIEEDTTLDNKSANGLSDEPECATSEVEQTLSPKAEYQTIFTEEDYLLWIDRIKTAGFFSFDVETTSLDYMVAELVGFSFAINPCEAVYLPMAHDYPGAPDQLSLDSVLTHLKPILENPQIKKVGHNLKYDMNVLANYDIYMQGIEHDSMLESYVLDTAVIRHNMDAVALTYLDYTTTHYEEVAGKGAKQIPFSQVSIDDATPYAAEDADISLRIHQELFQRVQKDSNTFKVYHEIEMRLIPVLSRIERNGVLIDRQMLATQSAALAARMIELETQAHEMAGQPFNLNSPKQLQEILFVKQGIPVKKKTPKGVPSTAEAVLVELAEEYELPALILENRSISKLKSTYTEKLPKLINPKTGRVHTSYHQAVTATGRLSSSDPNLQNIPIRKEEGRRVRQAFIAKPGNKIVAADYSQIELRIMAHISGDEGLLNAFKNGIDIHKATAAEVFSLNVDSVTSDQRRAAKAINFGLIYGMSVFGLAKQLNIGRGEAQDYTNLYFERYPKVKEYMENTKEIAKEKGYVETILGRRLYVADINSKNGQRRQYAERAAINAPMQGTAADIIKLAMIKVDSYLQDKKDIMMTMQVHDELVFEVPQTLTASFSQDLKLIMEDPMEQKLLVPLIVDIGIGDNWEEAH